MTETTAYGTLAQFASPEALLRAIPAARKAGYRDLAAYAPFPVPGLAEALGARPRPIGRYAVLAGLVAALAAFAMQWYSATLDYPIVVGGKPLNSWPAFLPVTFEVGILAGVLTAVIAMLVANRLPMPYHPVFHSDPFDRASQNGFFLLVRGGDRYTADTLRFLGAVDVEEVPP